jgi:hypothetical protein
MLTRASCYGQVMKRESGEVNSHKSYSGWAKCSDKIGDEWLYPCENAGFGDEWIVIGQVA